LLKSMGLQHNNIRGILQMGRVGTLKSVMGVAAVAYNFTMSRDLVDNSQNLQYIPVVYEIYLSHETFPGIPMILLLGLISCKTHKAIS